nr:MAG TPA: hypothetical protein [Caudoviricetes sp.]
MIDLTNRGSRCLYHVRLFRDLYILTSAQSFVLGRKSPFSFELHLLRGGEKNEG